MNNDHIFVFFDLDNTIVNGNIFAVFLGFCYKNRILSIFTMIKLILFTIFSMALGNKELIRREMMQSVVGLKLSHFYQSWSDHILSSLDNRIIHSAEQKILRHREEGHSLILVTNNIDFILKPLAEYYGFYEIISFETHLDSEGRITIAANTGKQLALDKKEQILNVRDKYSLDLSECFGYGDSVEDFEFLSILGNPFLVEKGKDRIVPFN